MTSRARRSSTTSQCKPPRLHRDHTEITPRWAPTPAPTPGRPPRASRRPEPPDRRSRPEPGAASQALPLMRPVQVRLTLTRYATECVRELSRYAAKHTDHAAEEVRT